MNALLIYNIYLFSDREADLSTCDWSPIEKSYKFSLISIAFVYQKMSNILRDTICSILINTCLKLSYN